MADIFAKSQWDTLVTYLQQGRPPIWILLAIVNGGFLLFWIYMRMVKDRPMRPASVNFLRVLFLLANIAVIFREDTLRLLRPFLRYLP